MAIAKLSCGACGAALAQGTTSCRQCGEPVQLPAGWAAVSAPRIPCPVCGHRNAQPGAYCESCGASLEGGPAPVPAENRRSQGSARSGRKLERWKLAAGVLIALVVVLFGYLEINRPQQPTPPSAPPATQTEPPMEEVRRLQEAVRANPGNADDLLRLANRLHDMGLSAPSLLNDAIEAYTRYLQLRPADPNARVDLGICYFELGRTDSAQSPKLFQAAVREMKAVMASAPTHQPAAFNLGVVSLFMGDTDAATRWFRKTIDLGPETELGRRAKNLVEQHAFPSSTR